MAGIADLPLHDGHVPPWMLRVMKELTRSIVEAIIDERGPEGLVRGLTDPLWFQAFNNIIGMDWDSSGSTTVVVALLKQVSWEEDLGFLILGGKGSRMLRIPEEALEAERRLDVDSGRMTEFSKVSARATSVFLQDGFDIYEHAVVVTHKGPVLAIDQGMSLEHKLARRYHLDKDAIEEPFSGVAGIRADVTLNATAAESREARKAYLDILSEGKERVLRYLAQANAALGTPTLLSQQRKPERTARYYRPVMPSRQLLRSLERLTRSPPASERELALAHSLGPTTLRALALIADIVYSIPTSDRDPLTLSLDPFAYAYAVGGKDGVPYPFDRKAALEALSYLREAVERARVGDRERLRAMARLRSLLRGLGVEV